MNWIAMVLAAVLGQGRVYHAVTVEQLAAGQVSWPYAQTIGRVRTVRSELDGDMHAKLTGITASITLECIPELPCKRPPIGSRIRAWGIPREDKQHGWWELHPTLGWEIAP